MDPKSSGFWLLPSHGRAHDKLQRFFAAAIATGISTPGYVVVDEADYAQNREAYDALCIPDRWSVHLVKGGCLSDATEEAWKALIEPDTQWIGWLADDLIPETLGWDWHCIEALNGWNCVSSDDGKHAPHKFNGATVWSADLLRTIGYIAVPGTRHFFLDTMIESLAPLTGCWTCLMDVRVRHAHAIWTGERDSTTFRTERFWADDERAFQAWRDHELVPVSERILALAESYGVKMFRPDLKGMRIMLATPSGDGTYDRQYVNSLRETERALAHYGAVVHWAELPFCSDVALARNKLFGQFFRGDDTHMVWLDSDMGWRALDLVTLLMSGHDFCAVAGPRKTVPPSYAVDVSDEHGRPAAIQTDPRSGFLEVTGVGGAFVVITRACATRMVQSYPELAFNGTDSPPEWGVYTPMVTNNRYRSEDYAFCDRWRAIGGRIFVAAEISLKHAGVFVWEGSWWGELLAKLALERAA